MKLTWAVDGYGIQTVCHRDLTDFPYGIACPISPEHFWELMDILEEPAPEVIGRPCQVCEGWGSIGTGIDEAPSVLCDRCNGTGIVYPPQQPKQDI